MFKIYQARHLGGGGGSRGSHDSPPPLPCDLIAKNLPQQHLPKSTILHQFAAKNEKKARSPITRVNSHLLNAKYQFKQYFTGGRINLFRKYPSNLKFDPPPFKYSWARACMIVPHKLYNSNSSLYYRFKKI